MTADARQLWAFMQQSQLQNQIMLAIVKKFTKKGWIIDSANEKDTLCSTIEMYIHLVHFVLLAQKLLQSFASY